MSVLLLYPWAYLVRLIAVVVYSVPQMGEINDYISPLIVCMVLYNTMKVRHRGYNSSWTSPYSMSQIVNLSIYPSKRVILLVSTAFELH